MIKEMDKPTEEKLTIVKVFYDDEVVEKCPDYNLVVCEKAPYPYYNRLANYTANSDNTDYISKVLKSVEDYFQKNIESIDGLLIKLDIEAVIMSAVLQKFSQTHHLKVKLPSYEAVFLCNHKYYQRTKERNSIKFSYIDVDDNDEYVDFNQLPAFPFFFKAPELQLSIHQYIIQDCLQLQYIKKTLSIVLPNYNVETKYINKKYLDLNKYPLATKNIMVCEEMIKNCLQLNWEGWADDRGNIFTYGFTDELLADQGIFSDFIMPSIFPSSVLKRSENICHQFLQDICFQSGFANIELWIHKTDYNDIRIIEVNPRCAFPYHDQYQVSYAGAHLYNSIIRLSMGCEDIGIIPDIHKTFTGMYSCQAVFATRCNGKISELLDFVQIDQEKRNNPDYRYLYLFKDREFDIQDNCQNGARVLMRVYLAKPSYEEAKKESIRLKQLFLLKDKYYMEPN